MPDLSDAVMPHLGTSTAADITARQGGSSLRSAARRSDFAGRLGEAREACCARDVIRAMEICQTLLFEMPAGPDDSFLDLRLATYEVQAHLSYMGKDYPSATTQWSQMALRLHAHPSMPRSRTRDAAGNAMVSWMHIDDADRAGYLPVVLHMLETVATSSETARARWSLVACLAR